MNIYIDTEFDGYRGPLISIALVSYDGDCFYAALPTQPTDLWVKQHVMPVLCVEPVGLSTLQAQLEKWLARFDRVHVVADYPTDIQHFCWLLETQPGMRIDTPPLTMEIRRDVDTARSRKPHNALADAVALRDACLA